MKSAREMSSRERVLCTARRQAPDRIPRLIQLESKVALRLSKHIGGSDLQRLLKDDLAGIFPLPTSQKHDFSLYFKRPAVRWDEWGRGRIWDPDEHYAEYLYPLENAETADEILNYPWPDFGEAYRYRQLPDQVGALHAAGYGVSGSLEETVFEIAWQLRSMDRLFEDISQEDDKAVILLDKITDLRVEAARQYAKADVDILSLGDDVAMQNSLMMSPKMWRRWFRPRLERVIQSARSVKPDILIEYHSDGKIDRLVSDLIEAGVDILNPVQPECVDHAWVKAVYGDQLSFSGGLGVQSVLPFGSPEDVREHVFQTIQILGSGGGLIIGPSHVIEWDVSTENILAMLEAIDMFGVYQ